MNAGPDELPTDAPGGDCPTHGPYSGGSCPDDDEEEGLYGAAQA